MVSCYGCTDKEKATASHETVGEENEETATDFLPEQDLSGENSEINPEKPNQGDHSNENSPEKETGEQKPGKNEQETPPKSSTTKPSTSTEKKPSDTPQQPSTTTGSSRPGSIELPTDWW